MIIISFEEFQELLKTKGLNSGINYHYDGTEWITYLEGLH